MITYNSPKFNQIYEKNKEILLKNKINIDDSQQSIDEKIIDLLTEHVTQCLEPVEKFVSVPCPKCGKPHLISMQSTYTRNVIFKVGNILIKLKIDVPRLKCNNCGSTHATIPSFCIPFKQYSKQAVLEIVAETNVTSTQETADKLDIDPKQVRRFVNTVKYFENDICLLNKKYSNKFKNIYTSTYINDEFDEVYFKEFRSIYLYIKGKRKIYINFKKLSN